MSQNQVYEKVVVLVHGYTRVCNKDFTVQYRYSVITLLKVCIFKYKF